MVRYSTPIFYFLIPATSESREYKSIVSRFLYKSDYYQYDPQVDKSDYYQYDPHVYNAKSDYYQYDSQVEQTFAIDDFFDTYSDSIDECLYTDTMNAVDPLASFYNEMSNYCTDTHESTFELALVDYDRCTGESLSDFIETFLPAAVGIAMTCVSYLYEAASRIEEEQYSINGFTDLIFQEPMPDECVASLLGDNEFGNFLREHMIHPGKDRECLAMLGQAVPACTLRRWPIPIPGFLLKVYSCIENKMEAMNDAICKQEIQALSDCLPAADDMKTIIDEVKNAEEKKGQCDRWAKACTIDSFGYYAMPSMHILLPRPLSAAPFSDTCMNIDSSHGASSRLEVYQSACIPEEDRKIWSDGTGIPDLSSSRISASNFGSSSAANSESNKSSNNSFWKFSLGLICGIAGAVGIAVFLDRRRNKTTDDVAPVPLNPESSLT